MCEKLRHTCGCFERIRVNSNCANLAGTKNPRHGGGPPIAGGAYYSGIQSETQSSRIPCAAMCGWQRSAIRFSEEQLLLCLPSRWSCFSHRLLLEGKSQRQLHAALDEGVGVLSKALVHLLE